jgi:hypothetical protein
MRKHAMSNDLNLEVSRLKQVRSCHINELHKDSTGIYPYRELFRLFRESDYDRVTLCEVGRGMPDAASGEEMLRYYKALWTELAKG